MIVREYECPKCGKVEQSCSIVDDSLKTCPTCGAEVKRVWGTVRTWWKGWVHMRDAGLGPDVHG